MSNRLALAAAAFAALPAVVSFAAATAEVKKGVLRVRGDAVGDEVAIGPSPTTPGSIRVEALGTKVNGADFVDFAGVKSIDVDLGGGDDLLRVGGVGATRLALKGVLVDDSAGTLDLGFLAMDVKGNVAVNLGAGSDALDVGDCTVSGKFDAKLDPPGGPGAADVFGVSNSQIGTLNVFFGPGNENPVVASTNQSPGTPCKFKSVKLDLGDGNDFLTFNNNDVASLTINAGTGDDTLGLLYLTSLGTPAPKFGSLDLTLGDGRDIVVVGSNSAPGTTVGKVKVRGGDGDDVLAMNNCNVTGTIDYDAGAGADQYSTSAGSMSKGLVIKTGAGDDVVNLLNTQFLGTFKADGGEGTDDRFDLRGTVSFKMAPALKGFESGLDRADVVVMDDDDPAAKKLVLDIATGVYELFLGGTSVAQGTALVKAGAGTLTFTSKDAAHPFVAKLDVAKHAAKVTGKHGGTGFVITDALSDL